jgi:hypothetical protein
MENCVFLNSLRNQFFLSFSMLEKVIEICPDALWNKKVSGFIFWQQLIHVFCRSTLLAEGGKTGSNSIFLNF